MVSQGTSWPHVRAPVMPATGPGETVTMQAADTHRGSCFCGAVEIEARGAPFAMGFCHCADCRAWSAQPLSSFTIWSRDAVAVVRGGEHLISYSKDGKDRKGVVSGKRVSVRVDLGGRCINKKKTK